MNRNDPLKCCIEDGVLIMQIGVEALAHAIKLNPELSEIDDDVLEEPDSDEDVFVEPEISDPDKFAQEVLTALRDESEDGTTLLHIALDTAAMNAIENGAEGIKMPDDIIRERRTAK